MTARASIGESIRAAEIRLRAAGVEIPERTARWLWEFATGMPAHEVLLRWREPADPAAAARFAEVVRRRESREPLQYILGEAEFAGLPFAVDRRVLIPRPETEQLVEAVCADLAGRRPPPEGRPLLVADIGTGSGAIITAVTHRLVLAGWRREQVRLFGLDISPDAVAVARGNAHRHGLGDWIEWGVGSYLAPLRGRLRCVDVVVSNPPYIDPADETTLAPEIARYEPAAALFAEGAGLGAYARILVEAALMMARGGSLYLELGAGQAEAVSRMARGVWPDAEVSVADDVGGVPRVLSARPG